VATFQIHTRSSPDAASVTPSALNATPRSRPGAAMVRSGVGGPAADGGAGGRGVPGSAAGGGTAVSQ
jgi:hypothetical protein